MPGPAIGFLQEVLRWWDRWLKNVDNGIDHEPQLNAYIMENVPPDAGHRVRSGQWITQTTPPTPESIAQRWFLGDGQLRTKGFKSAPVMIDSPLSCGLCSGEYMPWYTSGFSPQLAMDQREDDAKSVS